MDLLYLGDSLEERLDRINFALQAKMQELDLSSSHIRNPSVASYIHSYTASFCNLDLLDVDTEPNKSSSLFEENIEKLLQVLDRAQMQLEDCFSESREKQSNPRQASFYIQKLEQENTSLRAALSQGLQINTQYKNPKLEQERKNFEEKLNELDFLILTYKSKHAKISDLEEKLRDKERLLEIKEKQLRQNKEEFCRKNKKWEEAIVNHTLGYKTSHLELQPLETRGMTLDKMSELDTLHEQLKQLESKYGICDFNEKSRLILVIDQTRNKIAAVRGQQAVFQCSKSSKVLKVMAKAIEKEVSHEEMLRKSNLEKFSVRGVYRDTPKSITRASL